METLEENVTATVIIPTFQRPQFVMRAIKSVLTQTYPHFKLHIYDNHSGDETEKVVRSFNDPRIIYHCREKNIGYIRNINEAFKSVDTPLFCFFCDDDWIQPENLEILVKLHQENPSIGVACGIYNEIDLLGNEIVRSREPGFFHAGRALPHEVNICGSVIKSSVFKKVGFLRKEAEQFIDYDFLTRCTMYYPFMVSDKILATRFVHSENISNQVSNPQELFHRVQLILLDFADTYLPSCAPFYHKSFIEMRKNNLLTALARKRELESIFYLNCLKELTKNKQLFFSLLTRGCHRSTFIRALVKLATRRERLQQRAAAS